MDERARRAARTLRERFGERAVPLSIASAPGRINLIGGHTDYNDGFVLPVGIDRRTAVAVRPRADGVLAVHSTTVGDSHDLPVDDLEPVEPRWVNYVAGVVARFRERGHAVDGLDVVVDGDVPMGAGLASSAALEVATAGAIASMTDADLDGRDLATLAWEAETAFVGVDCGIMDQFAATFARSGRALFLDCRSREFETVPLDADADVGLLVTDVNVRHDLVDSAYNERVRQCRAGVAALASRLDRPVDSLRDVSRAAFETHADGLPDPVRRRCRHVISENQRVRQAADALREGDCHRVGELMSESHASLRDDFEVSCEELDVAVAIAGDCAAVLGSRMTGAGFGGSVVSLVRNGAIDEVASTIGREYSDATGIDPTVYDCQTASGLTVDRVVPEDL